MSCYNDTDALCSDCQMINDRVGENGERERGRETERKRASHCHTDRRLREKCKSAASVGLIPPPSVPSCTPAVQNSNNAPPCPANDCSAHYTHSRTHTALMLISLEATVLSHLLKKEAKKTGKRPIEWFQSLFVCFRFLSPDKIKYPKTVTFSLIMWPFSLSLPT